MQPTVRPILLLLAGLLVGGAWTVQAPPLLAAMGPTARQVAQEGSQRVGSQLGPRPQPRAALRRHIHSVAGLQLQVPRSWQVSQGPEDLFTLAIPGHSSRGVVKASASREFPPPFAVILAATQAEQLVASIHASAQLRSVTRFQTDSQLLSGVAVNMEARLEGTQMAGSIYVVAAVERAYFLTLLVEKELWPTIQMQADAMARSLEVEGPLPTYAPVDGALTYTSQDGALTLSLPGGWQIQDVVGEDFSLLVADADMTIAAGIAYQPATDAEEAFGLGLLNLLLESSDAATAELQEQALTLLLEGMDLFQGDGSFELDDSLTAVRPGGAPAVIRMGGLMPMEEISLSMVLYIQVQPKGIAVAVFVGDVESILARESAILEIVTSVQPATATVGRAALRHVVTTSVVL